MRSTLDQKKKQPKIELCLILLFVFLILGPQMHQGHLKKIYGA